MEYRKSWLGRWIGLLVMTHALSTMTSAQLVQEYIIARGQIRNLSVSYVANSRVYVATSSEVMLAIYDFNASPSLRGQLNYPGNLPRPATAIWVDGNYAYVHYEAGSGGKLAIVNVSNPDSPSLAGELTFPSSDPTYISMAKSGNYLYLFPYQGNFAVVDVSNPASPVLVRRVTATASAGVVVGSRLYTAEGANGIRIYDLSQPDNPTLVNTINAVSNIGRVAAVNGRLYALRSYNPPLQLHIFELTDPDAPNLVGTYSTERVAGLAAMGNLVFLSGFEKGTEVLDVANPSAPQQVRVLPYHYVQNADTSSGFALMQGQSILVLYNPNTGQERRTELPYPIRAEQRGNFIYAVQETSVVAFDISNPSMPSVRGTAYLDIQRESNTNLALIGANHVAVSAAGVLYIYEHTGSMLNEVARRDPGGFPTTGFGDRVRVSGDTLAMSTRLSRVQLYDVSNPANPQERGFITASTKFDIQGNLLYAVQGSTTSSTLRVYNIDDPDTPTEIGSVALPQNQIISDIAAGSGYVLTSDWQGNLALVDVRTPSTPQIVAQLTVAGVSSPRVAFDGAVNVFYVYDGFNRKVYMFRVTDFPNLNPVSMTLNRTMYTLSFYGERVIGAGREEGLILYRNTLFGGPVVSVSSVTPSRGANEGRLMVQVFGTGFVSGATVRLERGVQQLNATQVQFVNNTRLDATFEFNGQPENTQWDVVVRNPDGQEARLPNGFSIVEAIPQITSISPTSTLPLSSVTVTITGALIKPNAQVILLPPNNISVNPITATNVEYLSQTRIRATFNLSPYQSLQLLYSPRARVQVRNPNNRESNLVELALNTPLLRMNVARSIEVPADATTVAVEVELEGVVPNEPIQVFLRTGYQGNTLRVDASQVQSLGNNRWCVTFPATNLIPDNFALKWNIFAHHLGTDTAGVITFYRPYAARGFDTVQTNNLQNQVRVWVEATNVSPSTTVVLRQGDRVIEPTSVRREADTWRVGVTQFELTYPIRLEDLGDWNAEVRYGEGRTATVSNVLSVSRGSIFVQQFEWLQSHTVLGTLKARLRIRPHLSDIQVRIPIPPNLALDRTELVASRIIPDSDNGSLIVEFDDAEAAIAGDLSSEVVISHPLLNQARLYPYPNIRSGTLQVNYYIWVPTGYRAGRVNNIGSIYITGKAPYPETPYLEFPLPVLDSVLQSGQFIAEYKIYRNSSELVAEGELPLTPDNYTIRAVLKPVSPNTTDYYSVQVRFVPTGRSAPPTVRSRGVPVVVIAVVGTTVLLSYLGHQLLDATCNSEILVQAIQRKITENLPLDETPPDASEIRRLLRILYDDEKMQGFVQAVLKEVGSNITEDILKQKIADYLRRRLPDLPDDQIAEDATNLANYFRKFFTEEISFTDILEYMFQNYLPGIPTSAAKAAVNAMLEKGKGCLDKVEKISKIYMSRMETRQRADVGFSYDPNEKLGAGGIDGYIRPDESLAYEIKFENLATATAAAEEVLIEDVLPEGLDLGRLEFLAVQVGNMLRAVPEGTNTLNLDIDMRPERPVIVQVRSELDPNTRTLRVRFKGIDPNTGDYSEQGFLPPNQTPPQGEGSVSFRIRPLDTTPSGTQLVNRATIIFDPHLGVNAPIVTNAHTITLDKQPPTVTVEVPASAIPETRAQLSWQATDDASGVNEVEIWAQEGENARRIGYTRAAGERQEQGRVTIRARRFGDETRILTRARDRVGNVTPFSDQPVATIRMGQPPRFSAGLHLIALPLRPDANDLQPLFGFQNNQWATYNPATGQYVQYPDANAAPAIGRGYWVVLPNTVQPNLTGDLPDPEQRYAIELQPGWNLIANPWTEPLVWHRNAVQVRVQGLARPLSEAGAFVEPYLWGWEPNPSNPQQGRYTLLYDAQVLPGIQNTLQPWQGYWIYAKQACVLELPTPDEAALFAGLTRSHAPERNGGWSFRIGAQLGDSYDEVLLGVSGNEQGLQVAMPPAPPTRSALAGVQLRLVRDGVPMEAEIVPRSRRAPTWTLEVHAPPSEEERTRTMLITAPDITHLPRGVNPVLRDTQTGERRFLRNSAGWQIPVPREGLTRTYEISLVSTSRLLRIMGLQVQPNRGVNQHTIQFTLSDEARVNITVLAQGQVVRTLEQGRSRGRGVQQVVWDGRDAHGRALPPGNYQILVQAETGDGQIVRATAPIILTR